MSRVKPEVTRRSYVALAAFNAGLFTYKYAFDQRLTKEVGVLSLNELANPDNCPKGRVLHENGRKLNPSDGMFNGANDGVTTYMVGVYDPVSSLSGFIDPNSPLFGIQNTDKPIYLGNPSDNLGNGVLTNGPIETTSYLASNVVNVPLYNAGGNAVPYNPANTTIDVFVDSTKGNIFVITVPRGCAATNVYVYFNTSPLVPGDVPGVNGSLLTIILVNAANRQVVANFGSGSGIVKRTANTLVLPDGDPTRMVSNIMFACANNYIIELNRSGVMSL